MTAPTHLTKYLPAGWTWHVVHRDDWTVADRGPCWAETGEHRRCGQRAVAADLNGRHPRGYCAQHLGWHRWVDGDRVMAWRAGAA
jgi:hypothetical protein